MSEQEHESDQPQNITLVDESGHERAFRLHDAFDFEGVTYYLVEDADDSSEVLLLREIAGSLETVDGPEFQRVMTALEHDEVN